MAASKTWNRTLRVTALAAAGLVLLGTAATAQACNPNPGITVNPHSREYRELSARWWQWAYEQPVTVDDPTTSKHTNPLVDTTGAAAHNGQPRDGDIFFLAGLISLNSGLVASAERTIDIRPGTRLFFPILNSEWDNAGDPPTHYTVAQLRDFAAVLATRVTNLYVTVDGVALQGLDQYRVISPVFRFTLPPNDPVSGGTVNIAYYLTGGELNLAGKVSPAVGDGFYVLLNPLKRGKHTVKFGGTTVGTDGNGNPSLFQLDITYHITVK